MTTIAVLVLAMTVTFGVVQVRLAECRRERTDDTPEAIAAEQAYFATVKDPS